MKYPKVDAVWKTVHRCAINPEHSPVIHDLLYCGVMFIREAMKASLGNRPQSSSRIALDLIAKRPKRLRLYRGMSQRSSSSTITPSTGRNHRNHV
jgi:hypothetical protein